MLHSSCSLFGDVWDTNFARQFLKISDEELKILDSVPGWSKVHEVSEEEISESKNNVRTTANLSIPLQTSIPVNAATQSSTLIQNPNNATNILVQNSDSPQELSKQTTSIDKDNFMHSISLYFNRVVDAFSILPRKRSNSASDIHLLKVNESMSSSKSETNLMAKKITCKSMIPIALKDKTNNNQITGDIHNNTSPEKLAEKKTFEKLGADILNHPYLKEPLAMEHKFKGDGIPSKRKGMCREQLRRKLELLKKRFSQPGTCDLLSSFERSTKNEVDLESISSQKQSTAVSELTEEVSETQTGICLSNFINDNKEIITSTVYASTNMTTSLSLVGVKSPGKTKQKQNEQSTTIQAEDEAVVKLIHNVPEDKSCTSQQDKLIPVVIHLSKSGSTPPSSDWHSSPQHNSINQFEMNSKDTESNISVPSVITLSTDAHSFAEPYSINQSATVKSKDVGMCVPVPCGLSSSSDLVSSAQLSLKSHSETLPSMKSKDADICVPVPGDIPPSSDTHLSIQSNLANPEIKSSIHNTSSSCKMSSSQPTALPHLLISKIGSPIKVKGLESCVVSATSVPSDLHMFMHSNVLNRPEPKSMVKDEDSVKVIETENEGATFSVFSDNPSGWVMAKSSPSSEVVKLSGKRKRDSKGDHKPQKKLSLSNSLVDIQYTAEQVRNMIEIMRFQFNM